MHSQVKRKKPPFMRIEAPPSPADALIPRRFSPDTATKYLGAIVRYFHRRGIHLSNWVSLRIASVVLLNPIRPGESLVFGLREV